MHCTGLSYLRQFLIARSGDIPFPFFSFYCESLFNLKIRCFKITTNSVAFRLFFQFVYLNILIETPKKVLFVQTQFLATVCAVYASYDLNQVGTLAVDVFKTGTFSLGGGLCDGAGVINPLDPTDLRPACGISPRFSKHFQNFQQYVEQSSAEMHTLVISGRFLLCCIDRFTSFNLIYWTSMGGLYILGSSSLEKCGKFWKNGRFSGRIRPDWGNTAREDMAGLGSIGLRMGKYLHAFCRWQALVSLS